MQYGRSVRRCLVGATMSFGLMACGTGEDRKASSSGEAASAIINGTLDTTHQAVVAIILQRPDRLGICTGTIVKTDPVKHIGWVATAAHCNEVPMAFVVQGNDMLDPNARFYDVIDVATDSRWDGAVGPYDFAMVRIAGVDANTPTIPLSVSPDGITATSAMIAVGYGQTAAVQTPFTNTVRRRVDLLSPNTTNTPGEIEFDMSQSGGCYGDSGGPNLIDVGGVEHVAGITAHGADNCDGLGYSGRVSIGSSFWDAQLAKTPADSCTLCMQTANSGDGACAAPLRACHADRECRAYFGCMSACTTGDCSSQCVAQVPSSAAAAQAAVACACSSPCAAVCAGDSICAGFGPDAGPTPGDAGTSIEPDAATCVGNDCGSADGASDDAAADGGMPAPSPTPVSSSSSNGCAMNTMHRDSSSSVAMAA